MEPRTLRRVIGGTAAVLMLVSVIMVLVLSRSRCEIITNGSSTYCDAECGNTHAWISDNETQGFGEYSACPWGAGTIVITCLAVLSLFTFVGFFLFAQGMKPVILYIGVGGIFGLIVALFCMFYDLGSGKAVEENSITSFTQTPYIMNTVLTIFSFFAACFSVLQAYKGGADSGEAIVGESQGTGEGYTYTA